ncbi:MAG TPA: hypothetical protein VH500_14790 [Nitrososphaeraceae archaeon]|jgi:hypothetical protein
MISKLLSSSCQLQKQQNYNNKKTRHKDTVSFGIDFIPSHIKNYDRSYQHKEAIKQPNYKLIEKKSFLICKSCFWCASSYCSRYLQIMPISSCPLCDRNNIKELALNSSREDLVSITD